MGGDRKEVHNEENSKKEVSEFTGQIQQTPVPSDPKKDLDMMSKAMNALIDNIEVHIKYQYLRSKINRALYDAMIQVGFTKEQAFEYLKVKGV